MLGRFSLPVVDHVHDLPVAGTGRQIQEDVDVVCCFIQGAYDKVTVFSNSLVPGFKTGHG